MVILLSCVISSILTQLIPSWFHHTDARIRTEAIYVPHNEEATKMRTILRDAKIHHARSVFGEIWRTQIIVLPLVLHGKFPGARLIDPKSLGVNSKILHRINQ
jgi:hypothetical protein